MKILYIHQLFKTPKEGGGIRSYYLAKALVDAGHNVDMITTHNSKNGMEMVEDIRVHYLRIPYDNSFGFLKRLWAYGQFVLKARRLAKKLQNVDLAYVMTTPLTTGWIALWIKRKLNVPYYFEVGDLWPNVPVEMGVIKNSFLKNWLFKKEKEFYDQAKKVIAMSPGQVRNITKKTNTQIELIPNMADVNFFKTQFRTTEISTEDPLKILYCGAHGRANQLEFLVMAAQACQHLPISFTLMGAGSEKQRIQTLASGLKNVSFIEHGGKGQVREQMEIHDAIYLSFQNLPMLHTGCPNKFFDALAAGKVVFSNLGGWTTELITEKEVGFTYSGLNPEEFDNKIQAFLSFKTLYQCQKNAHALSDQFSRSRLSAQFLACIENH